MADLPPIPTLPYSRQPETRYARLIAELGTVALIYVAVLVIVGPRVRLSQWELRPQDNQAAAEALAWLDGRLDLPERGADCGRVGDKFYSPFPPLLTLLCFAVFGLNKLLFGDPGAFYGLLYAGLVAVPIPALFYGVFRSIGQPRGWAALLTVGAIAGTCLWRVAAMAQRGWIYADQHLLSQIGMAILLIDLFGRQRLWLGGIGVLVTAWSRQLTVFYAAALLWTAWRSSLAAPARRRSIGIAVVAPLAVTALAPMTLSYFKYGNPLESGYRYIFEDRHTDSIALQARNADGGIDVFATRFIPYNAYQMYVCPPRFEWSDLSGLQVQGLGGGTGIWWTTPLFVLLLIDARRWWSDPLRRVLVLCSVAVQCGLLMYHHNGYDDAGYSRYSLDFTLVWLAVLAPGTGGVIVGAEGRPRLDGRGIFTVGCIAWSVFYFYMVS